MTSHPIDDEAVTLPSRPTDSKNTDIGKTI